MKGVLVGLVHTLCYAPADRKKLVEGWLKAGCLLALRENGFGCIHWMLEAANRMHMKLGELGSYLAIQELEKDVQYLCFFHLKKIRSKCIFVKRTTICKIMFTKIFLYTAI